MAYTIWQDGKYRGTRDTEEDALQRALEVKKIMPKFSTVYVDYRDSDNSEKTIYTFDK